MRKSRGQHQEILHFVSSGKVTRRQILKVAATESNGLRDPHAALVKEAGTNHGLPDLFYSSSFSVNQN